MILRFLLAFILFASPCMAGSLQQAHKAVIAAINGSSPSQNWVVHDSAYSTDSNQITLNNVAAGDLILIGHLIDSDYDVITSATDGTSSLTVGAAVSRGGYFSSQYAYLLSSVATGTVTYTVTCARGVYWNSELIAYAVTPSLSVSVDTAVTDATVSFTNTDSITSSDFTTSSSNEIVFGLIRPNVTATVSDVTINDAAVDGTIQMDTGSLSYKIFTSTFTEDMHWTLSTTRDGSYNLIGFQQ